MSWDQVQRYCVSSQFKSITENIINIANRSEAEYGRFCKNMSGIH